MFLIMVLLRYYKKKYFLSNPAMELRDPVIRRRVGLGPEGKELEAAGALPVLSGKRRSMFQKLDFPFFDDIL